MNYIDMLRDIYSPENIQKVFDDRNRRENEQIEDTVSIIQKPANAKNMHEFKPVNAHTNITKCVYCGLFKDKYRSISGKQVKYSMQLGVLQMGSKHLMIFENQTCDFMTCDEVHIKRLIE